MDRQKPPAKIGNLAVSIASQLSLAPLNSAHVAIVPIEDGAQVPAAFVRETDRDIPSQVVGWYEGIADPVPVLRRTLREEERTALERRRRDLLMALAAPADGRHGNRCAGALAAMLASFPAMSRHDRKTATAMVAGYLSIVADRPPWAIVEACRRVRSDDAGISRDFCPSEAALCAVVREIVAPYELQLHKTKVLLEAKPTAPITPSAALPAPRRPPAQIEPGYTRRALADLAATKMRRESAAAPSVFELDAENWNA